MRILVMATVIFVIIPGRSQNPLSGTLTMGPGNVAEIKQKAEAGDANAQVALGDSLASQFHATEALQWYRKAAQQGSVSGEYHIGEMLLFGAPGIPSNLAVQPNPPEGVRWTFAAATNFHPNACWNMGKALRLGLGASTNLIEAYAWLTLFSETSAGSIVGRVQMNELALKMDSASIRQAQALAAQFKTGNWVAPVTRTIPENDPRLKLNGITFGVATPLAVINGKTVSQGETVSVPVKPGVLRIKCLKIEKASVLILVEGEDQPRALHLN